MNDTTPYNIPITYDADEITQVGTLAEMTAKAKRDSARIVILPEDRALETCDRALARLSQIADILSDVEVTEDDGEPS